MKNIFVGFKKELGFACISNQYTELALRRFSKDYADRIEREGLETVSREVNLVVSDPEFDINIQLARSYIVSIHSCVEGFLQEFKTLPGSPTYGEHFDPEKDHNRLGWTMAHVYGNNRTDRVRQLYFICDYYRLLRNSIVHQETINEGSVKMAYSRLKTLDESLLVSALKANKLSAPNEADKLTFDDQVLFSRAAGALVESIAFDAPYDFMKMISWKKEELKRMIQPIQNNKNREAKKLLHYLERIVPQRPSDKELNEMIAFLEKN